MVLVMSAFSFLTLYPPASSGRWLWGVMACQGRNRRLVRDCPASIDAQMERKVQRAEGVTEVDVSLGAGLVPCRATCWDVVRYYLDKPLPFLRGRVLVSTRLSIAPVVMAVLASYFYIQAPS